MDIKTDNQLTENTKKQTSINQTALSLVRTQGGEKKELFYFCTD